ncbi:hypothetical protein Afe04nite_72520 [Asanoa ferruginea]|nr:hypothetical protein Afe04nite_72520 [Asanoa ferruginea]
MAGATDRTCGRVTVEDAIEPVVEGERQEAAHLVGEHHGLAVLGEGDEAYWPHRVASVSLCWPTTPTRVETNTVAH